MAVRSRAVLLVAMAVLAGCSALPVPDAGPSVAGAPVEQAQLASGNPKPKERRVPRQRALAQAAPSKSDPQSGSRAAIPRSPAANGVVLFRGTKETITVRGDGRTAPEIQVQGSKVEGSFNKLNQTSTQTLNSAPDARSQCRVLETACDRSKCLAEEEIREHMHKSAVAVCSDVGRKLSGFLLIKIDAAREHCQGTAFEAELERYQELFAGACDDPRKASELERRIGDLGAPGRALATRAVSRSRCRVRSSPYCASIGPLRAG